MVVIEPTPNSPNVVDVDARVRSNAGAAALAGGLLILFGFFFLGKEAGTDLSSHAANVFRYAIRLGGLALIGVAAWSSFGHLPALLADAVISVLVGVAFVVAAVLMLLDVGWLIVVQTLLYMICGTMFLNSALRTWRDYRELVRLEAGERMISEDDVEELAAPDGSPLASQLLKQGGKGAAGGQRVETRAGKAELVDFEPVKRGGRDTLTTPQDQPISLDEAPDQVTAGGQKKKKSPPGKGYLADFDKQDHPTKR